MSSKLFILLIFSVVHVSYLSHIQESDCPETDQCNGQYFRTLEQVKENKLDCGNYARYLACLEDKIVQCQDPIEVIPPDTTGDNSTENPSDNSTYDGMSGYSETLVKMKEARTALCEETPDGVIDIDPNYSKLFLNFLNTTEKFASFDYYPFVYHNLSMRTGCDILANCTLVLQPYAEFSEVYFPCPALLEFEDCFNLYKDDCPDMDNLPWLSSSVQSIDQECQVGSSTKVTWSLLLLITTFMTACY